MRDRLPQPGKEGHVKLTNVTVDPDGTIHGKIDFDDGATQDGSAWSKANVLPDDVCDIFGLDRLTAEPKDAFLAVPVVAGRGILSVSVKLPDGTPWAGCHLSGLNGIPENQQITDQNGNAVVFADAGTYSISIKNISEYVDITVSTQSVTLDAGQVKYVTLTAAAKATKALSITTTRNVVFSPFTQEVDAFLVGGGGGGAPTDYGGGGGGGRTKTVLNASFSPDYSYAAVVGAGGSPGTDGGTSSLLGNSASGGAAGLANYNGGNGGSGGGCGNSTGIARDGGSDGGNGGSYSDYVGGTGQGTTTRAFGEASSALYAGGGGGGSWGITRTNGGSGGGGGGGSRYSSGYYAPANGAANKGGGGGGGGGSSGNGASGGSGIILLRWRTKL